MQSRDGRLQLSATDLANFLACRHRTALDVMVATGQRARPAQADDPLLQLLFDRGIAHEKAYVDWLREGGLEIADLTAMGGPGQADALVAATTSAMQAGAHVIVQGGLRDGSWFGKPDILMRVDGASSLGNWSYEVYDTKLARNTKAGAVLQLGLYSEMVARVQGRTPERFYIIAPRMPVGKPLPEELSRDVPCPDGMMALAYRVTDFAAYTRLVRDQMNATVARDPREVADAHYPEPVPHCAICRWNGDCDAKRHADDHISLVANVTRAQRRELEAQGITTLTRCADTWPLPAPPARGSLEGYENAHVQARLQLQSRQQGTLLYELRPIISAKPATDTEAATKDEGLCRLPAPSAGDVFLDLEGDPYAVDGGREYLIGVVTADDGRPAYRPFWGFDTRSERESFEAVMDLVGERRAEHPEMHVYHYAAYEQTAFKKLRLRHEARSDELDELLRAGVFVDLYAVVRRGLRVGSESYSIKALEPLYGFARAVDLDRATAFRVAVEVALQTGEEPADDVLEAVRGYNEDDCVSTLRLRDWLEQVRAEEVAKGNLIPRPTTVLEKPKDPGARELRAAALRPKLLDGVPDDPALRSDEQKALWLLAHVLDYHRREALASFWEYYRLRDLPEDELEDEPKAITGLEFVERVHVNVTKKQKPTGVVIDRYRYPPQEMEIEGGNLNLREGGTFGEVVAVDREAGTVDVRKQKVHRDYHPAAVFEHKHFTTAAQEDSIYGIAERVVEDGNTPSVAPGARDRIARALLLGLAPRLTNGKPLGAPAGDIVDHLTHTAGSLDACVLPVQGPPGAGKTHAGAAAICALVAAGKKVGVTATSHKVALKLLAEIEEAAKRRNLTLHLAHKSDEDEAVGDGGAVTFLSSNQDARQALADGSAHVVGGTAWLWSDAALARAVDVLFVDEAGQMSLANVLAMCPAATDGVVLLGDPRQLEQPKKAAHPDGVDVSALEHMLAGHATVPDDRGIFLPKTWRMCPPITAFTSEVFYEGRLSSIQGLERQQLAGGSGGDLAGAGLRTHFVLHDGNRSYSNEEVETVRELVTRLLTKGVTWTDQEGLSKPLAGSDVLVVAPYNAQVSRLVTALAGTGARAGTVDKFQGQQAPVVIYSMATSRPEDAPRGMEFLYSLNRFNVATSRARCLVIVVASERLFEPECRSPRQMRLANALCRYRELGS